MFVVLSGTSAASICLCISAYKEYLLQRIWCHAAEHRFVLQVQSVWSILQGCEYYLSWGVCWACTQHESQWPGGLQLPLFSRSWWSCAPWLGQASQLAPEGLAEAWWWLLVQLPPQEAVRHQARWGICLLAGQGEWAVLPQVRSAAAPDLLRVQQGSDWLQYAPLRVLVWQWTALQARMPCAAQSLPSISPTRQVLLTVGWGAPAWSAWQGWCCGCG